MAPEVVKWNETADSAGCRNRPKQTEWQAREGMLSSTKQFRAQRADTRTPIRAVRSVALDASQISKLGTILATRASTFEPCRGGLVHSKNARALEYRKPNAHISKSRKRTSESTSFPIHDRKTPRNIYPFGPWIDPPFRSAANEFRIPITLRSGPVSNEKFSRIGHHGFVTRENYVTAYRNGSGLERVAGGLQFTRVPKRTWQQHAEDHQEKQ